MRLSFTYTFAQTVDLEMNKNIFPSTHWILRTNILLDSNKYIMLTIIMKFKPLRKLTKLFTFYYVRLQNIHDFI